MQTEDSGWVVVDDDEMMDAAMVRQTEEQVDPSLQPDIFSHCSGLTSIDMHISRCGRHCRRHQSANKCLCRLRQRCTSLEQQRHEQAQTKTKLPMIKVLILALRRQTQRHITSITKTYLCH